jgi:hypothetical protein
VMKLERKSSKTHNRMCVGLAFIPVIAHSVCFYTDMWVHSLCVDCHTQGKTGKKCLLTQEVAPRAVPKVPEVHGKQVPGEVAPRAVE